MYGARIGLGNVEHFCPTLDMPEETSTLYWSVPHSLFPVQFKFSREYSGASATNRSCLIKDSSLKKQSVSSVDLKSWVRFCKNRLDASYSLSFLTDQKQGI